MATSVFIGCSSSSDLDNTRSNEMEKRLTNGSGEKPNRIPTGKQSGGGRRKKVNESSQKKVRQRGMGVEQLERLRFQDRIKKMTEINPLHSLPFPTTPAFGGYNIVNGGGVGAGQVGFDVHGGVHNHGPVVNSGVGSLFSDHEMKFLAMDPFAVGSGFRGTDQTSRELSSIPNNLKWNSECGVCYKKFRGNGENLMCNGERKFCGEMTGFGNFGSVGNKGNMFNGGNPYYYGSKPAGQEAEVVAVHRKGMNTGGGGGGGSVLMEYEFFPGKVGGGNNYCNYKELINMATSSSSSDHHHQDFIHGVGEGGAAGSNLIDLSLKL